MNYGFGFQNNIEDNLGQTVTVFTTSGGESGSGFTGVLAGGGNDYARLITQIGAGPSCALGNCYDDYYGFGGRNMEMNCSRNNLGVIVDIPYDRMAAFVHNTVGVHW